MAKLPPGVAKTLTESAKALDEEKRRKQKEESLLKKVGRKLREIYYGEKTYLPKKRKSTVKRKPKRTAASLLTGYARKAGYKK